MAIFATEVADASGYIQRIGAAYTYNASLECAYDRTGSITIRRTILSYDTSSIPDTAIVTAVSLSLRTGLISKSAGMGAVTMRVYAGPEDTGDTILYLPLAGLGTAELSANYNNGISALGSFQDIVDVLSNTTYDFTWSNATAGLLLYTCIGLIGVTNPATGENYHIPIDGSRTSITITYTLPSTGLPPVLYTFGG